MSILQDENIVGDIIDGRYQLTQLIGRGGSGVVFKAVDQNLHNTIAIKILSSECAHEESVYRRFEREGRILRQLRHPNTVFFYDSGKTEAGLPYLVMEYVEGIQLKTLLEQTPVIEPERAVSIITQVLSALNEAHSLNFIHRDLKPSNIMLNEDMGFSGDFVKVLDFGVATLIESQDQHEESFSPDATRTIDVVGTPKYMAPEQFRSAPLTMQSDLYSVGCIAYEMLAGFMPFDGETFHMVIANHLFQKVPDLPEHLSVYPILCNTIYRLLEKEPENRYGSAQEVIDDLARWNEALDPVQDAHAFTTGPIAQPAFPTPLQPTSAFASKEVFMEYFQTCGTKLLERQGLILIISTVSVLIFSALLSIGITRLYGAETTHIKPDTQGKKEYQAAVFEDSALENTPLFLPLPEMDYEYIEEAMLNGFALSSILGLSEQAAPPKTEKAKVETPPVQAKADPPAANTPPRRKTPPRSKAKSTDFNFQEGTFAFTFNYTPVFAKVTFSNLEGNCKGGTCKFNTKKGPPPRIHLQFPGFEAKSVTLSKEVSTLRVDLKRESI